MLYDVVAAWSSWEEPRENDNLIGEEEEGERKGKRERNQENGPAGQLMTYALSRELTQ